MRKLLSTKIKKNDIKTIILTGINITIILFLLNLLSFNLAILEQHYTLTLVIYILIGFLFLNLPLKHLITTIKHKSPQRVKLMTGLLLILLSFIILSFTSHQFLWIAFSAISSFSLLLYQNAASSLPVKLVKLF